MKAWKRIVLDQEGIVWKRPLRCKEKPGAGCHQFSPSPLPPQGDSGFPPPAGLLFCGSPPPIQDPPSPLTARYPPPSPPPRARVCLTHPGPSRAEVRRGGRKPCWGGWIQGAPLLCPAGRGGGLDPAGFSGPFCGQQTHDPREESSREGIYSPQGLSARPGPERLGMSPPDAPGPARTLDPSGPQSGRQRQGAPRGEWPPSPGTERARRSPRRGPLEEP